MIRSTFKLLSHQKQFSKNYNKTKFCRFLSTKNLTPSSFESVNVVEKANGVSIVTLQRPELHNAFNASIIQEIKTSFDLVSKNENIKCVVLTADGKTFSAGADLTWMKNIAKFSEAENKADSEELYEMFSSIRHCPAPVIGRINGSGLGGGAGLVSCCDIVYSVEKAKFGFTEVKLGLIPAVISPFVIEKIGVTNASRYFLTGERFTAKIGKEIGLVNETFDSMIELDEAVANAVAEILTCSPAAVRAAKKLITNVASKQFFSSETKDYVTDAIASIRVSEEGQEGLSAFLNKRKPSWLDGKK
mmetsp:Transcript_19097/g.32895  ORF Transcript_19097/g.32895 Transcript_19097/m.32895 type:complete len:303 (-) Transcript_19097:30-938(-)